MRPALTLLTLAALFAAGCSARGDDDPFAYIRKPLYTGSFDLEQLGENHTASQRFWVTDGSIGAIKVQVWVNATAGAAVVKVLDPDGNVAMATDEARSDQFPLALGDWSVVVEGTQDAKGMVGVFVTRG